MPQLAELPLGGRSGDRLRSIKKEKRPGETLQAVLVGGVFFLVGWRNRAAIGVMQTKLGEGYFIKK